MKIRNRILIGGLSMAPKWAVWPFARNYIAGRSLEEAIRSVRSLNKLGIGTMLDFLGEEAKLNAQAEAAGQEYSHILYRIGKDNLNSCISAKPTQFGLKLDEALCYGYFRRLAGVCQEQKNFLWIDMEDSSVTDRTIELYLNLHKEFTGFVGLALQAYLWRSVEDAKRLAQAGAMVRLCKGIYCEPAGTAFTKKSITDRNYIECLRILLEGGCYTAIATHDEEMYYLALRVISGLKLDRPAYEFQMLYGVNEWLRDMIIAHGHKLLIYAPYGRDWKPYSVRRFRESPDMLENVKQGILSRKIGKKTA